MDKVFKCAYCRCFDVTPQALFTHFVELPLLSSLDYSQ